MATVAVDGAGDEARTGAECQGERVEWLILRAERRGLGDLPELARRRGLPLGETVDLVVQHQDLDRHVAAQRMNEMVAPDREHVAVAAQSPDRQVGSRHGQARGERRRASVDAVHSIRVHVVGEATRAADAGHEHDPLERQPELGQELLDRGEHRVVTAAGTPACFLTAGEVLLGERGHAGAVLGFVIVRAVSHRHSRSRISRSSSAASSGSPSSLVKLSVSIRNSARTICDS